MVSPACALILPLYLATPQFEAVDRIAIVVDQEVITRSEIYNQIRISAFENGKSVDLSLRAQKQAARQLIDQALIHNEMVGEKYAGKKYPDTVKALEEQLRRRYPSREAYRRALEDYGITPELLTKHIRRQLQVLGYIKLRFGIGDPRPSPDSPRDLTPPDLSAYQEWLQKVRKRANIAFHMKSLE